MNKRDKFILNGQTYMVTVPGRKSDFCKAVPVLGPYSNGKTVTFRKADIEPLIIREGKV
jgi:hypothetical protein